MERTGDEKGVGACALAGSREWLALKVVWRGIGWRAVSGLPSATALIGRNPRKESSCLPATRGRNTTEARKRSYNMGTSRTRPGCNARETGPKSSYFSCAKNFFVTFSGLNFGDRKQILFFYGSNATVHFNGQSIDYAKTGRCCNNPNPGFSVIQLAPPTLHGSNATVLEETNPYKQQRRPMTYGDGFITRNAEHYSFAQGAAPSTMTGRRSIKQKI